MFKQVIVCSFIVVLLFLMSCEREFVFENTEWDSPVVLNGLLVADSLPSSVFLYHTQAMGDTSDISPIEDATMWFESGGESYTFEYSDSGCYICNIAPKPGKTYRVNALINGDTIWAETTIPSGSGLGRVSVDTLDTGPNIAGSWFYYNIDIKDVKEEDNKYWFWVYELRCFQEFLEDTFIMVLGEPNLINLYTKTPYADDFIAVKDPGAWFGYTLDYEQFLRIPDDGFNGEDIVVDLYYPNIDGGDNGLFYMAEFDEHYDKYMKTYLTHADYLMLMDEFTLYYQPSFVYSNVHNGTGILGSMAVKDTVISDNPLFQIYK